MDEKTIQRIKKLQALAERGVGGEKTTAQEYMTMTAAVFMPTTAKFR